MSDAASSCGSADRVDDKDDGFTGDKEMKEKTALEIHVRDVGATLPVAAGSSSSGPFQDAKDQLKFQPFDPQIPGLSSYAVVESDWSEEIHV